MVRGRSGSPSPSTPRRDRESRGRERPWTNRADRRHHHAETGHVAYAYDGASRRTATTLPPLGAQTRQVAYAFDTAGRLSSVTDWLGRQSVVAYTADGLPSLTTYANGVTGTSHYDRADRFDAVTYRDPANASLREYGYTLDAAGNRTKVDVTEGGGYVGYEQYAYDALGRMTSARTPDGGTACYAYDANGNRTLVQDACTGAGTAYSYDAADRLTSVGGTLAVGWDANGNRTSVGSDGYAYDWANRMTSATVGGATTTYKYAGDDSRLSKTASGATTPYTWDRRALDAQLLDDGSTSIVWAGKSVVGEVADTQTGTLTVLLQDALGSVRATTNAAGAVDGQVRFLSVIDGPFTDYLFFTGEPETDAAVVAAYLQASPLPAQLRVVEIRETRGGTPASQAGQR